MSETPDTRRTSHLLTAGIVAGPLFITVALVQAFTREGFDWARHPTSMLSLGDLGWIQIANFVVAGLLFFACSRGIKSALRDQDGRTWAPILVGTFAVALIVAGVFLTDAGMGFPPGAPEEFPTFSWHGIVHSIGPTVGINALFISFFVFARYFSRQRQHRWMIVSIVAGVVAMAFGFSVNLTGTGETGDEFNFLPLWAAMMTGWSYLSILAWKLRRQVNKPIQSEAVSQTPTPRATIPQGHVA